MLRVEHGSQVNVIWYSGLRGRGACEKLGIDGADVAGRSVSCCEVEGDVVGEGPEEQFRCRESV